MSQDEEEKRIGSQATPDPVDPESVSLEQALQSASEEQQQGLDIEEGYSLEELSQSYASAMAQSAPAVDEAVDSTALDSQPEEAEVPESQDLDDSSESEDKDFQVTPRSILEALLFVGKPDNAPVTASEIAKLMRGVSESDVVQLIAELQRDYEDSERAFVITEEAGGYKLALSPELNPVRERFYGRVRTTQLNQSAIDCLALVAYQPGISRSQLDEQRGQSSSGILNQLIRRQLISMKREPGTNQKPEPHYFPTEKLLSLAGLDDWEDLPQVEDFE